MASDDLRARIAEALCPPHHRVGSFSSGGPVTALSPCLLHQAQADTVAALVQPELDRRSAPSRPCKHGVLPEQGLCLYCASEQRATVPGVDACYSGRHCVTWGFCRRCAPELAEEASRLFKTTGGSSEAYAAIVKGLTEPTTKETPS